MNTHNTKKARSSRLRGAVGIALGILIIFAFFIGFAWAKQDVEKINGKDAATGDVLIKFRAGTPQANIDEVTKKMDETEILGSTGAFRFHSKGKNVEDLIAELTARSDVEYVEPNYIIETQLEPNDPDYNKLYGMTKISAPQAWDITTGSTGVVVTVVDTGIDYTHPDLVDNMWSAPAEFTVNTNGIPVTCAAGTHGYNAILNTCNPMDDHYHGTHCAGTIGGVGNNGIGVAGVNWNTKIMGSKFLSSGGSGTHADAIKAIEFTIQAKQAFPDEANVRVLSNSWGCSAGDACFTQALLDEIEKANDNDILFVAAAGNNGRDSDITPFYPSGYNSSNVVAVAATDSADLMAYFSNYGLTTVDLGAPGVNIYSTYLGGGYSTLSGTSMATPHVAGAATLILSACPDLTTEELKAYLLYGVDPVPSMNGKTTTGGRLNAYKSIQLCQAGAPDFTVSVSSDVVKIVKDVSNSGSMTINVEKLGGFSDGVTLVATGLPAGVEMTPINPSPVTPPFEQAIVFTVSPDTPVGLYTIAITGTSGDISHSAKVRLNVVVSDFTMFSSPNSLTLFQGIANKSYIYVTGTNGFSNPVDLSITGLPTGVTAVFTPPVVTPPTTGTYVTSQLALTADVTALPGSTLLTVYGKSGVLTHSTPVRVSVISAQGISINKKTNGNENGGNVPVDSTVAWTYDVTNTGTTELTSVSVTDDKGVTVTCLKNTLAAGEIMQCTASDFAIKGAYSNMGTATGTAGSTVVTATDTSSYFGAEPAISIDKKTNGGDDLDIPSGSAITWSYLVTNTGNIALTGVTVTDNKGVVVSCPSTSLSAGASMTCSAHGTAISGSYSNTGKAIGNWGTTAVEATDISSYMGTTPLTPMFTANSTKSKDVPLVVKFTDASIGATKWSWNFGDGSPLSDLQNPVHSYGQKGQYTVTLTVTNDGETASLQRVNYIKVIGPGKPA